jgi:ribokinase
MKYDVITFGSATLDVFLRTKDFFVEKKNKFLTPKAVCFPFASKVDLEDLCFSTGGGGTNSAATLSLQGFRVAYCGKIGKDFAGQEVLNDLNKFKIDDQFVFQTNKARTNLSIIFSWKRDKTCFVWRDASESLVENKLPWKEFNTNWFYLGPLSGKLTNLFAPLVEFAAQNKIKVFANPGNSQIGMGLRRLKPILNKIDIVLLNQEEASLLTGIPYNKEKEIFKKLDQLVDGIVVMTKGEKGAVVSDGHYLWQAKSLPTEVKEKTGAGDAFGSGFLSGFIKKQNIVFALQLAMANSSSCISKIGAKHGLLSKGQRWDKIRVRKIKL